MGKEIYRVVDGTVYRGDTQVTGIATLPMLKLAYETTLARRDPLFALPGTDPKALRTATKTLSGIGARLSALQSNKAEARLALRLYPIGFLQSLADLEEARQRFIHAPTPENARAYRSLLPRTIREKEWAVQDFTNAFNEATATSTERLVLFGGVLSSTTERAALEAIAQNLTKEQEAAAKRMRCTAGLTKDCNALPLIQPSVATTSRQPVLPALANEVLELWDAAFGTQPLARTAVLLSQSVCLPTMGAVYVTLSTRQTQSGISTWLTYVDDIFLYQLSELKKSAYADYMRRTYDMEYSPINPFAFYVCPQIGVDYGTAIAVARTYWLAEMHPDPRQRTMDTRHQFEELALMLRTKTAGLEDIVKGINAIMIADTEEPLKKIGNTRISYEFLTHSAFASFFRIGALNETQPLPIYKSDSNLEKNFQRQVVTYSSVRLEVPRSALIQDLRNFLIVENKLASTTPATTPSTK